MSFTEFLPSIILGAVVVLELAFFSRTVGYARDGATKLESVLKRVQARKIFLKELRSDMQALRKQISRKAGQQQIDSKLKSATSLLLDEISIAKTSGETDLND